MKLGFIGAGNMATAIMSGILSAGKAAKEEIFVYDVLPGAVEKARETLGVQAARNNRDVAAWCDMVFLAVKPAYYPEVMEEIAPDVAENTLIVSIAPGQTLRAMQDTFGKKVKILRTMPNTPALVREGMTAVCANDQVTHEELEQVLSLLDSFGKSAVVPESMMDAVVAVSGSSPAYVFMFIEALADGAVREGMPRQTAYTFAAQAVLGSARMALESGMHPGALKDMVCSPAGTTIEAVRVLEERGLRGSVMEAMRACSNKAKEMYAKKN